MTLTNPSCPANDWIPQMVRARLTSLPGVKDVDVELCWDPAWTPDMMSEDVKRQYEWGLWDVPSYP